MPLFHHQHFLCAVCHHLLDEAHGQGVLRYLEHRAVGLTLLHEVVVGNARCHDGTLRVVAARVGVVGRLLALGGEDRLCRYQFGVVLLRESGQEDEVLHILRQREFVLPRQFIGGLHHGAGMRHAGGNAQEDRCAQLLAERESVARHLVSLLLVRGLEAGNHGELRIEARVLLVLR